jgi:AraC family transcriptional regulator
MRRFTHRDRQRLDRAIDHYLRSCYRERRAARAGEFAACIGLSRVYVSRLVSALTGSTIGDLLQRRQLARAEEWLRLTTLAINEIALVSAFGTRSTFFRVFLAAYGTTPAAYRAQVTKRDTSRAS